MNSKLLLNAILFSVVVLSFALFSYFFDENEILSHTKPWHMQMNERGDVLSELYQHQYKLMDHGRAVAQLGAFDGTTVLILVDAWGVPYEERVLDDELSAFEGIPHEKYLHRRLMSYTKFAEQAEFRTEIEDAVYFFNGDSSEYNRAKYVRDLGYGQIVFCQKCSVSMSLTKVDSLINVGSPLRIVSVSLQSTREMDLKKIKEVLSEIAELAKKNPGTRFVIQGSHRPILIPREKRELYYQYWVPLVVLN